MKMSNAVPDPAFRILLVDDNPNGLLARKALLEEQGYCVIACDAPEKALELYRAESFDLIVTDYRMPGMNGTELIAVIRQTSADMPVILLSGLVDVIGLNEKNTGANSVIAKNANEVSQMLRSVNRLLPRTPPKKPVRSNLSRRTVRRRAV